MVENKPLFIADASVLVKWAIREVPNLEEALLLRDNLIEGKVEMIVPVHCFPEVGNLLGREHRRIALSFFTFLITSEILEYPLNLNTLTIAFSLMGQYHGISFYDASYHALAIEQKGTFITADKKYFEKTKKEGRVMLLKDYGKKR